MTRFMTDYKWMNSNLSSNPPPLPFYLQPFLSFCFNQSGKRKKEKKRIKKLSIYLYSQGWLHIQFPTSLAPSQFGVKPGSLLVLALTPCFQEIEAPVRCKTGWAGSLGFHWAGKAYTIHIPWRSTPLVSTLHVAALLSPLIHKIVPV